MGLLLKEPYNKVSAAGASCIIDHIFKHHWASKVRLTLTSSVKKNLYAICKFDTIVTYAPVDPLPATKITSTINHLYQVARPPPFIYIFSAV